jgi:hypothetical protein
MAFLILESPLAIAGIIWQLWNGITLPNLVPFLAPLLFLLIISHQSYFLQKKNNIQFLPLLEKNGPSLVTGHSV